VSRWLHAGVRAGHVLRLGAAAGDFVLPDPRPPKLLLLSGGSGITPVMSILRDLAAQNGIDDVAFVHHARSRYDVIFRRELGDLAGRHAGLRLVLGLSDAASGPGRFDEAELRRLVPDFAERETFLCGPAGLMARAERLWERAGATRRLHTETFLPAVPSARGTAAMPGARISLTESGRSFPAASGTLLEQLERAGERPAYGCRAGICRTCRCRKRTGTVENIVTGAVSSEADEDIQLCISVPRSDVELGL
jgi:ferredoxin-NADP reductase